MKRTLTFYLTLIACVSFAQNNTTLDSLQQALKDFDAKKVELHQNLLPNESDTDKVNILYGIAREYYMSGENDTAKIYNDEGLALSEKINFKKGTAKALNMDGNIKSSKNNNPEALKSFAAALEIAEEIGDKQIMAWVYGNVAVVHYKKGDLQEALKQNFLALKMNEELGSKKFIANALRQIGQIYVAQNNYPEGLKQYTAALKISEEIGDQPGMAEAYTQIAYMTYAQGKYPEALKNISAALKILEETGNRNSLAGAYTLLGVIKMKQGNYPEALNHEFAALKIQEESDDQYGIAQSYGCIGEIYLTQKKYDSCAKYFNKAFELTMDLGPEFSSIAYESQARLDSARGNYKEALEHYKKYIVARDSLVNKENTKKTTEQQMQFDFDKKESLTKAENDKELQKQKLARNGFMGGFAVVLLFAGVFFQQRNKTKKEKQRSDTLLLNIIPAEVAEEIKSTGTAKAKAFTMVTVMFTDFKDFTTVSEKISAELLVDEIHTCFSAFDNILHKYKIEKIKTIGDAYLCASGLPVSNYTHAMDMVNAAFEIRQFMLDRKKEKEARGEIPFELRIGIHTGPVVAGVVGVKKYAYDIWGDTVNIAARIEQNSEAGKINISGSTYELVKDKFTCIHRGKIQAKNKGEIDMYFVSRSFSEG